MSGSSQPKSAATRGAQRIGPALVVAGSAPFALAATTTDVAPGGVDGVGLACPFRAVAGIPCPVCGSTRAFAYAVELDARWLEHNVVVVMLAVLAVVFGLVALVGHGDAVTRLLRVTARPASLVALVALAWAWTLAHAGTIAPA